MPAPTVERRVEMSHFYGKPIATRIDGHLVVRMPVDYGNLGPQMPLLRVTTGPGHIKAEWETTPFREGYEEKEVRTEGGVVGRLITDKQRAVAVFTGGSPQGISNELRSLFERSGGRGDIATLTGLVRKAFS